MGERGFEIKCKKCGSVEVQTSVMGNGIFFDCVNSECGQEMMREIVEYDKEGTFVYSDRLSE